jgi:hypothetical protein
MLVAKVVYLDTSSKHMGMIKIPCNSGVVT